MAIPGSAYASLTVSDVQLIAEARSGAAAAVRDLAPQVASAGLAATIRFIAPRYGARQDIDQGLIGECAAIVYADFDALSLAEIRNAYRLWAAGRFDALEMYGGQFNATQFGRVLAAYTAYRRGVTMELARQAAEERRERERAEREARHKAQHARFVADFPALVARVKAEGTYAAPRDLPVTWYDYAEQHGLLRYAYPKQKLELCQRAERVVLREQRERLASIISNAERRSLADHIERAGLAPIYTRAKQYALWLLVLGRKLPGEGSKPAQTTQA